MSIKTNKPSSKSGYRQGYYQLISPEKYIGDPTKIIYRSSWEHRFCRYCDLTSEVVKWSSEPLGIKYINPIDTREHTYYVDFYMRVQKENVHVDYLAEIKPRASLIKPTLNPIKNTTKKLANYNYELKTWIVNRSKFTAANEYANRMGYQFILVTEDFLF